MSSSSSYPMIEMNRAVEIVLNRSQSMMAKTRNGVDEGTTSEKEKRGDRGGLVETVSVEADFNLLLGRVLARDVVSELALPPFDASIMDGYALGAESLKKGTYEVVKKVTAGRSPGDYRAGRGAVVYVTTGARLPLGTVAVVKVEDTKRVKGDDSRVCILVDSTVGQWIRRKGSDVREGQVVVKKCTLVGAAEIGMIAHVGCTFVSLFRKVTVGVLSTGDELLSASSSKSLSGAKIYDSNRPMLLAAVREAGAEGVDFGIVPDDDAAVESAMTKALDRCDIVLTSGGVSMGSHDRVKPLLERIGTVHFGRLRMKPGKPTTFASVDDSAALVFGLPGNPCSALVVFRLLVRPALRALAGLHPNVWESPRMIVTLDSPLALDPVRPEYHRATLSFRSSRDGTTIRTVATSTGTQRSSRLMSMQGAHALLCLPSGDAPMAKGARVQAIVDGSRLLPSVRPGTTPSALGGASDEEANAAHDKAAAYAFDRLVEHLQWRSDVQNIDLMNLSGMCRNCMAKWYRVGLFKSAGKLVSYDDARALVYGEPYGEWKSKHQRKATKKQMQAFEEQKMKHSKHEKIASNSAKVSSLPSSKSSSSSNSLSSACCKSSDELLLQTTTANVVSSSRLTRETVRMAVLTVSDRAYSGTYADSSGPAVVDCVHSYVSSGRSQRDAVVPWTMNAIEVPRRVVPDDQAGIERVLRDWTGQYDVIFTTGGTGFSSRDVTPEATRSVASKIAPALSTAALMSVSSEEPLSTASRGVVAIREKTIIVNLPGNPRAIAQLMRFFLPRIGHLVRQARR